MSHQRETNAIDSNVGILMPSDFPAEEHNVVEEYCRTRLSTRAGKEFAYSWNAVAYRFRAMCENDDLFRKALSHPNSNSENRYSQEREIFSFFMSGLSTLESTSYALWSIASSIKPEKFHWGNTRQITISATAKLFKAEFSNANLTTKMDEMYLDSDSNKTYNTWRDIRNILAHRQTPGRDISLSVGHGPRHVSATNQTDTWHIINEVIDDNLSSNRRDWMASNLKELLSEVKIFVDDHLS